MIKIEMKKAYIVFILLICANGIIAQNFLRELNSFMDFEQLAGEPLSKKYGEVASVKIVYNQKTGYLYFLNSEKYPFHFHFCKNYLHYKNSLVEFNNTFYSDSPSKTFLLGNINYYHSFEKFTLELSPVDKMHPELIKRLHQKVCDSSFIKDLAFFLNNPKLIENKDELGNIETIEPDDIYGNLRYQAIKEETSIGRLHFIDESENIPTEIGPNDILVLKSSPLFLPPVSGVIVSEFQTPLSHLSILAKSRMHPICAVKNAFEDDELLKLDGKWVKLKVGAFYYSIEETEKPEDIEIEENEVRKIKLRYNISTYGLADIHELRLRSANTFGNKASNFSVLYRLSQKHNFKVPESAFAIPFSYYAKHLEGSEAEILINELLDNEQPLKDKENLKQKLKTIRTAIKKQKVNSSLLQAIDKKILSLGEYRRMRFRSSTNAEDTKNFSGAGLYTSKTGIVGSQEKPIEKALQKVWASLWSYEAFIERELFNIDHSTVFMGILVHRSFPNEEVNGVVITKNIYRKNYKGFLVNAQLGEISVVKPPSNVICDQFICYANKQNSMFTKTIELISISNQNDGEMVMSQEEIQNLANQIEHIKRHFYNKKLRSIIYENYGLDLEFKLEENNRQLYIKQVRPY